MSKIERASAALGFCAILFGCYLVSVPLAFVVGGILLVADVYLTRRGGRAA